MKLLEFLNPKLTWRFLVLLCVVGMVGVAMFDGMMRSRPAAVGAPDVVPYAAVVARPQSSIAGAGADPILLFALIAAVSAGLVLAGHLVLQRQLRRKRRSIARHLQQ